MRLRRFAVWYLVLGVLLGATPLRAQQLDVIRGVITGPDSIAIAGARVTATSLSGNVNRSARTDTKGRFTITFPGGDGDYFVTITALGFGPKRFEVKRTQSREFFDELTALAERELKRSGEFVLPGMVKLVVQKRKARMGRNPATGEAIKIPAKTVVKARIAKQLKDAVLPPK